MGLHLALLLENGEEPKAWEYKRCPVDLGLSLSGADYVNINAVTFPWSRCRWGKVTALALMEASTGGRHMIKIDLPQAQTIDVSTQLEIAARSIVITGAQSQARKTIWQMLKEDNK